MKPRSLLTLSNFFASAHFFLIIYIITPYLATFMSDSATGMVVSLGAVMTLSVFPFLPALVRHFRPRRLALFFGFIELLALGWLAMSPAPLPAILLVAIALATTPLLEFQLDLLLEASISQEGTTGRIRTLFLTVGNMVLVIAPLIVGLVLDSSEAYWRVFAVAASSLIPFLIIASTRHRLPHVTPPNLVNIVEVAQCLSKDKDLRAVTIAHGTLQFFYHLAPLYISLYLHTVLRIPWSTLGWMFAIMLLPFVLLEYPAGWLADKKWGDKEIMAVGFILMALGFAALAFVTADTMIIFIVLILVVNRSGAALVEAMTEGHFFRRVSSADAASVSIFRITRPIAALLAPLIGSVLLSVAGYATLFVVTSIIIGIVGVMATLRIRDIK